MSKPKCPVCGYSKPRRKGVRRGAVKYQCQDCGKWFQVNHARKPDKKSMLADHLDGLSFRALANRYSVSVGTAYNWCFEELEKLPHCADITREYCSRFCGRLLVDGKFVKVKGYERKIPVIYGIDYLTHDIPSYVLAPSENYQACKKLFTSLRLANYPLASLTSDDNRNIYESCLEIYPKTVNQLCLNHYKENIRQQLKVRQEEAAPTHKLFVQTLEKLFSKKRSSKELAVVGGKMVKLFGQDPVLLTILADLQSRQHQLFANQFLKGIPTTTNLIESYNSHLQGRLETIKGFESFQHADLWLNGYFLRRRTKPFTDCTKKFRHLNGGTSLSQTLKTGSVTPMLF